MLTGKFFKPVAIAIVILAVVFGVYAYLQNSALAGALTVLSDSMTTHRAGVAANHTITVKIVNGIDADDYIGISFDYSGTSFTGLSALASGDITVSAGSTLGGLTPLTMDTSGNCSPADSTVDWCSYADADTLWLKLGASVAAAAGDYIQIVVGGDAVVNPSSTGAKTMYVTTYDEGSDTVLDYGAIGLYITNDQVLISATVDPTLTFEITSNGTVATSTCALGTLSTTGIASCTYYVGVGTNADFGFAVYVQDIGTANVSDGLRSAGGYKLTDVSGGTVNAGAEEYGFTMTAATSPTGQDVNNSYEFPTEIKVPTTATSVVTIGDVYQYTSDTTTTDCTKVEHAATIATTTPAGYYTQTVRYTVTANF